MPFTINKPVVKQIEVMKSKFIAYLFPLEKEEDFKMIAFRSLFISMAATDSLDFASRKLKKRNKNQ